MQHVVDSSVPKFQLVELLALGTMFPKPCVFFYFRQAFMYMWSHLATRCTGSSTCRGGLTKQLPYLASRTSWSLSITIGVTVLAKKVQFVRQSLTLAAPDSARLTARSMHLNQALSSSVSLPWARSCIRRLEVPVQKPLSLWHNHKLHSSRTSQRPNCMLI